MRLSEQVRSVFGTESGEFTFRDLLERVESKSFGLLFVILALPAALPVPAPGYAVPFGILMAPLAIQFARGRATPWFPEKVLNRKLKGGSDAKFMKAATKFIGFFERFVRPRGERMFDAAGFRVLLGAIVAICSLSMMVPLPLTNTAPAFAAFVIGLALLERDALIAWIGASLALIGLGLAVAAVYFVVTQGPEGAEIVKDWVKGLLGR